MAISKKTIIISPGGGDDTTTYVSVVHSYRCCCHNLWGAYSNGGQPLPRDPVAKLRELGLYINEVIPKYKFHRNVAGSVWDWTVSCATTSNVFPLVLPSESSSCSTCMNNNVGFALMNSTISSALFERDLSISFAHGPPVHHDDEHDSTDCSMCLREFEDGEDVRVLPKCEHQFHVRCIDWWLCSQSTCPICGENTPVVHTTSFMVDLRHFSF
ncbi:hypothetical protein ACOSP7_032596 [Xanthoceras sorbifolium]